MKISDSHMHVGQFFDHYYTPAYIVSFIDKLYIEKAVISSTTTCEENYEKVITEMKELIQLAGERIYPVLWITPKMLKNEKLPLMLQSGIRWKCIKIHGFIHNWHPNGKHLQEVINIALKLKIPLLFHTGGIDRCDAGVYLSIIQRNPKQKFILAHGRPIEQTIEVMKQCSNAWADTAFMPIEDIKTFVETGYADRILFGTDFPITIHNEPDLLDIVWYANRISKIIEIIRFDKFKKISEENFNKLFC